ncbi:hypothetical protein ACQP2U_30375 [Nocardia sp. CA-084685]|uniref:hypothetical protein n=1 Tax=Nocardia sp. CA-084685 TaxID=3239970 RepID=UPI003D98E5F1
MLAGGVTAPVEPAWPAPEPALGAPEFAPWVAVPGGAALFPWFAGAGPFWPGAGVEPGAVGFVRRRWLDQGVTGADGADSAFSPSAGSSTAISASALVTAHLRMPAARGRG